MCCIYPLYFLIQKVDETLLKNDERTKHHQGINLNDLVTIKLQLPCHYQMHCDEPVPPFNQNKFDP
jgi:hypothetical protein